jgi:putative Mn2+ efflux pump MntP
MPTIEWASRRNNSFQFVTKALITGFTSFLIPKGGIKISRSFGIKVKPKAEFIGEAVLAILGTKRVRRTLVHVLGTHSSTC